jgi:hypothetical protein
VKRVAKHGTKSAKDDFPFWEKHFQFWKILEKLILGKLISVNLSHQRNNSVIKTFERWVKNANWHKNC